MSIYNSVEIQRLSSEVEDIKQKQEFLIEDMQEVKEDMSKHDQRMKNIQAAFDKIRDSATIAHYENLLMLMTTLFRSERDKR